VKAAVAVLTQAKGLNACEVMILAKFTEAEANTKLMQQQRMQVWQQLAYLYPSQLACCLI
jgi:hypothetical protein